MVPEECNGQYIELSQWAKTKLSDDDDQMAQRKKQQRNTSWMKQAGGGNESQETAQINAHHRLQKTKGSAEDGILLIRRNGRHILFMQTCQTKPPPRQPKLPAAVASPQVRQRTKGENESPELTRISQNSEPKTIPRKKKSHGTNTKK